MTEGVSQVEEKQQLALRTNTLEEENALLKKQVKFRFTAVVLNFIL